ncbi:hypothetical protein AVEN_89522-1 [Araneus ventricosus]|uniref:ribonuclease H n=1 Tax=Araneus ventricosus TaxID=182803 RepID=A0A4Y2KLE5_ARAVE|nr:hypothetical protein AVEN_89522-1 [Araneus ventricosus]
MARQIFKHLIDNPNIKVSWIKAHVNYPGNEKADELAKEATTTGQPYTVLLPTTHIKSALKARLLTDWQELWTKGDTGCPIHKVLPKVSLHAQNWSRELTIFLMEHGPFPTYLHRFRLSQTDCCNCGEPTTYEPILKGHQIHPADFNLDLQISTKVKQQYPIKNATYTDGSRTEGTGSAFCHFDQTATIIKEWQAQLHTDNNIFQAELLAINQAILFHQNKSNPSFIWTDSLSSLQAIQNPTSPHPLVQEIQNQLHSNKSIHIGWVRAHVGHLGNESADALAKDAIIHGTSFSLLKPLSHLKKLLNQELLTNWKKDWDKLNLGKPIHEIIPTPSFKNHNWDRREVMFFTEHGPFTSYLKRFNLRSSDDCSCGDIGTPLHYATSCPHTKNWHFSKPSSNNLLHWKKSILNNNQSRKRLQILMTFLMENDTLINGPSTN